MTPPGNIFDFPKVKRSSEGAPLPPAGGDGTSGGMEGRVAKLEAHAEHTNKRLDRIEARLEVVSENVIRLDERVKHLPTKGWAVGAIVTLVGLIVAIVTLAPKLQALAGTATLIR